MLPQQKLYLHENQTGKGINHGDFETRFSPIPWEAQKSGSHCQLPVSVFQLYFQHRLEFFATTFGSYSPFLEREAYGNAWQSLRFCSPEVVNSITTKAALKVLQLLPKDSPKSPYNLPRLFSAKLCKTPGFSPRDSGGVEKEQCSVWLSTVEVRPSNDKHNVSWSRRQ